jgi:hypothetical protein
MGRWGFFRRKNLLVFFAEKFKTGTNSFPASPKM